MKEVPISAQQIKALFQKAWRARLDQDIETVMICKADLKPLCEAKPLWKPEWICLEASLARSKGDVPRAKKLIDDLMVELDAPPPRALMERGLNYYIDGQYMLALDDFLTVFAKTRIDPKSFDSLCAMAAMNAVLCFEYLNIETTELPKYLAKCALQKSQPEGLRRQWQAYLIRQAFSQGELHNLRNIPFKSWDQATYHLFYLKSLPYLKLSLSLPPLEIYLQNLKYAYLRSFRLRTLLKQHLPDDENIGKRDELIERLYLWTWFWLTEKGIVIEDLMVLLAAIARRFSDLPAAALTKQMLLNAVSWISKLQPGSLRDTDRPLQRWRQSLSEKDRAGLLGLESCLLADPWTQSTPETARANFKKAFPFAKTPAVGFLELFDENPPNSALKAVWLKLHPQTNLSTPVVVDVQLFDGSIRTPNAAIHSRSLSLALELLRRKPKVSCVEFAEFCLSQREYDEFMHAPKIFNTLGRLRRLLPGSFRLQKRGDYIYATGPWELVRMTGQITHGMPLHFSPPEGRAVKISANEAAEVFELLKKQGRRSFSRIDLEEALGKSRASVNRLLVRALNAGWLEAVGEGRSRKYNISEKGRSL